MDASLVREISSWESPSIVKKGPKGTDSHEYNLSTQAHDHIMYGSSDVVIS